MGTRGKHEVPVLYSYTTQKQGSWIAVRAQKRTDFWPNISCESLFRVPYFLCAPDSSNIDDGGDDGDDTTVIKLRGSMDKVP